MSLFSAFRRIAVLSLGVLGLALSLSGPALAVPYASEASMRPQPGATKNAQKPSSKGGARAKKHSNVLRGQASFYDSNLHGQRTSTGHLYQSEGFTAASNRLPLHARVMVRRVDNGKCVLVRVQDRKASGNPRLVDLSYSAAQALGMIRQGVVTVDVEVIQKTTPQARYASCVTAALPKSKRATVPNRRDGRARGQGATRLR